MIFTKPTFPQQSIESLTKSESMKLPALTDVFFNLQPQVSYGLEYWLSSTTVSILYYFNSTQISLWLKLFMLTFILGSINLKLFLWMKRKALSIFQKFKSIISTILVLIILNSKFKVKFPILNFLPIELKK